MTTVGILQQDQDTIFKTQLLLVSSEHAQIRSEYFLSQYFLSQWTEHRGIGNSISQAHHQQQILLNIF